MPKKIIFNCNLKFSKTPGKIINLLKLDFPEYKFIIRNNKKVTLPNTKNRFNIFWGCKPYNKLEQYKLFKENNISHPEWTNDIQTATNWQLIDLVPILARTKLNSYGGKGIHYIDNIEQVIPPAPLYTKYKKKKQEYRIHFLDNIPIDWCQKKKKTGFENRNNQIRNYKNGWIYARENINIPDDAFIEAYQAILALKYKQGAVDIIWNEKENKCYVLEVNSAPGLDGTTLQKYTSFFKLKIKDYYDNENI